MDIKNAEGEGDIFLVREMMNKTNRVARFLHHPWSNFPVAADGSSVLAGVLARIFLHLHLNCLIEYRFSLIAVCHEDSWKPLSLMRASMFPDVFKEAFHC